jgi:hypothetical protein
MDDRFQPHAFATGGGPPVAAPAALLEHLPRRRPAGRRPRYKIEVQTENSTPPWTGQTTGHAAHGLDGPHPLRFVRLTMTDRRRARNNAPWHHRVHCLWEGRADPDA